MNTNLLCANMHYVLGKEVCSQIRFLYCFELAAYDVTPEEASGDGG